MPEVTQAAPATPKASRLALPRWLDPKLLLGVLLVLVAMLLGARVFAAADDTVPVWGVKADMAAGDQLTPDTLVVTRVHFATGAVADNYISAAQALPTGQVLSSDVRADEMLTQGSVRPQSQVPTVQLAIPIAADQLPVAPRGALVDVITTPKQGASTSGTPVKILGKVRVTAVPSASGGAFSSGTNAGSIIVRVDPATQRGFDPVKIAQQLAAGTVLLLRYDQATGP